jgi:hypothetical protein
LLRDALGGCVLFDQTGKELLRLAVDFVQIAGELAGGQQVGVGDAPVLTQPARVPLTPDADAVFFAAGQQIGEQIFSDLGIAAAALFVNRIMLINASFVLPLYKRGVDLSNVRFFDLQMRAVQPSFAIPPLWRMRVSKSAALL